MSKADNNSLGDLHGVLANCLKEAMQPEPVMDKDGNEVGKRYNAAILNVVRQFLKDNGVEALPSANKPLQELAAALPFPQAGESEYKVQ